MGPLIICNAVEVILRVYEAKRPVKGSEVVDGGGQGVPGSQEGACRGSYGAIRLV